MLEPSGSPASVTPGSIDYPSELPLSPSDRYTIVGELGRGGVGLIFKALDRQLGRMVAIKELVSTDPHMEARFVREAIVTARLEHPAIVTVHEAGRWPNGKPFYAMHLVAGRSFDRVVAEAHTLPERLALLPHAIAVAEAIAYAHSRRVIHRDIKPANVLVGQYGETVVIDWGLAKDLGSTEQLPERAPAGQAVYRMEPDAGATSMGDILGTLAYMPPEQSRGEPVDERADVYALGALLYQLLSGCAPHLRAPGPPSGRSTGDTVTKATKVLPANLHPGLGLLPPPMPLAERQAGIPGELLDIVTKAMAQQRDERYANAGELAEDLKRFQTGQMVSAHAYGPRALAMRWVRAHRLPVSIAASMLVTLLVVGAVSVGRIVEARRVAVSERHIAVRERSESERHRAVAQQALGKAEEQRNLLLLMEARAALERDPTETMAWLRQYPVDAKDPAQVRRLVEEAWGRGVAARVWREGPTSLNSVAWSPDGKWLATGGQDHAVRLWDAGTGKNRVIGRHEGQVRPVEFAASGQFLVSGGDDRRVRFWDLKDPGAASIPTRVLGEHEDALADLAIAPDGGLVASGSIDGTARLWPVGAGVARVLPANGLFVASVAFSPDGASLVTGGQDHTLRIFEVATGAARAVPTSTSMEFVRFGADGQSLLAQGEGVLQEWSLAPGAARTPPRPLGVSVGSPWATAVSPDGAYAATTEDGSSTITLWNLTTKRPRTLLARDGMIMAVAFSPDGRWLASVAHSGTLRIWPLRPQEERVLPGLEAGALAPRFFPDGRTLVAGGVNGTICRWDVASGVPACRQAHEGGLVGLEIAPDGQQVVTVGAEGVLRLWDRELRRSVVAARLPVMDMSFWNQQLAYASDGQTIGLSDGNALLVLIDPGAARIRCRLPARRLTAWRFHPDGRSVLFNDAGEVVRADVTTCARTTLFSLPSQLTDVELSHDGRLVGTASEDGSITLFHTGTGTLQPLGKHGTYAYALKFSPDSRYLATVGVDRHVRLVDLADTTRVVAWPGHLKAIVRLAFTPDGKTLITAGRDNNVWMWEVATGAGRLVRGHDKDVSGMQVAPDGATLATGSQDGTVRLWPVRTRSDVPDEPGDVARFIADATSAEMDDQATLASPLADP